MPRFAGFDHLIAGRSQDIPQAPRSIGLAASGTMRTWPSELLVLLSVPPIPPRHAAVACVRGSGWAELNAALQSEDFMGVIGAAGLNRRRK